MTDEQLEKLAKEKIMTEFVIPTAHVHGQIKGFVFGYKTALEKPVEKLSMQEVLHKWFKDESYLFYTGSDKLEQQSNQHTLRYEKNGGIFLFKSSTYGDELLGCYQDPEILDQLIAILVHKS